MEGANPHTYFFIAPKAHDEVHKKVGVGAKPGQKSKKCQKLKAKIPLSGLICLTFAF